MTKRWHAYAGVVLTCGLVAVPPVAGPVPGAAAAPAVTEVAGIGAQRATTQVVKWHVAPVVAADGVPVTLRARVTRPRGSVGLLQWRRASRWKTVGVDRTDSRGRLAWTLMPPGTGVLRVRVPATEHFRSVVSALRALRVPVDTGGPEGTDGPGTSTPDPTPAPSPTGGGSIAPGVAPAPDPEVGPTTSAWQEPDWCTPRADLSAVRAAYTTDTLRATLMDIARLRYPPAVRIIETATDERLRGWLGFGGPVPTDFTELLSRFEGMLHEESHRYDRDLRAGSTFSYRIVDDSRIVTAPDVDTFPRSEILTRHPDPANDPYVPHYLTADGGGWQDVNILLEELVQYATSLASGYCVYDIPANTTTSLRDGALTFMWWMELYLTVAREDHPDDYAEIIGSPGLVSAILQAWDRAEYWMIKTRGGQLSHDAAPIAARVYDPANLAEITRLRTA